MNEHNRVVQHHVVVKLCVPNFDNIEYFRLYQEIIITFALPSFFGYLILQMLVKSDINLTTVRKCLFSECPKRFVRIYRIVLSVICCVVFRPIFKVRNSLSSK